MWHVERGREREIESKCWKWQKKCEIFKKSVLPIRWADQVTAACQCPNMSLHSIYRLQTRTPSEFWVNKSRIRRPLKRVALSSVAKRQFLCVPQLLSATIFPFFLLEKCKKSWEVVAAGIFVRVLLQQLGGANDPILAGLMLMHCCIGCDAQRHWCIVWWAQLMQLTLSADPTFNWAAQAHLKAAKPSSLFWLFPQTLMASFQLHWLF